MKLYYKIWVDTILKIRAQPQNEGRWKTISLIFISMAMAMNFITAIAILQRNILDISFYNLNIDILPGTKLDALLKFTILFLLPAAGINYFLIFHDNKYEILVNKYKSHNGKLGISYLLISFFLPLVLLSIAFLWQEVF